SPKGRLRIDIALAVAKAVVIPALPDFQQKYPQIELVLGASDQPTDLIGEGIDCVVRVGELKDSSMVARKIGAMPMVTCASPAYLARYGLPRTLDELHAHKAVNFFSGRNRRVMEWAFRPAGKVVTLKLPSGILTDDSEAFLACGLAGMGLLQGLRPAFQTFIDSGHLVEILPGIATVPKPVSALYPNRSHLPDKVRVFVEWLTELFARRYPL
ncbi:MAG TPA: LysR substrate-binding domain-containing protein, partial [Paraburkholderia sp.]|nr:LysR substrate-binding domain-containing protein [Paraburkholderia sp.]